MTRRRTQFLALAVVTLGAGLFVHFASVALPADARDILGDLLWAMMIAWCAGAVAPHAPVRGRAAAAYGLCVAVELGQLLHSPTLDSVRATTLGRLALGSGFDLRDLVSYASGVLAAMAIERGLHRLPAVRDALEEFLWFGLKQARACLFAGLFFLAVFGMPRAGILDIPRYDLLLIVAIAIQAGMLWAGLETWDEVKAITLFHLIGFALEVFKTSDAIRSWSYPTFAYTKVFGVPLFSGFMYAAVGSYIIQSWRLMDLRIRHHPPYWMASLVALAIYANFFTHHFIPDLRWYLAALALGLYARTTVVFRPLDEDRRMPLLLSFVLIGFFIWLAENISTFFGIWRYPEQLGAWTAVHVGKWSSWSLLVVMTFTIVANLKHIKERVHVPE